MPIRSTASRRLPGRPRTIPQVEARIGMQIEAYIILAFNAGKSLPQVARDLRIGMNTIRRRLRARNYRVRCRWTLEILDQPPAAPGQS